MSVDLRVVTDESAVAQAAADVVAGVIRVRPEAVIGFPTGVTPVRLYAELAARVARGELDCSRVTAVALDEYLGVAPSDPRSFADFLRRHVLEPLGISGARAALLDGTPAPDDVLVGRCLAHERAILEAGGVELQIVGIGRNGHLGFNEPGTPFRSRTRVTALAAATRVVNALEFAPDPVPMAALTQGLATIEEARTILLVATGDAKAAAVAAAFAGPVEVSCPASVLQRHADVRAVLDGAAASLWAPLADAATGYPA